LTAVVSVNDVLTTPAAGETSVLTAVAELPR